VTARLHVMLGDGGVGKTTLAAAYALALAERGQRVALLGIDPARRLQGALGLSLEDGVARVPVPGELHAALLLPEATLRRWATEGIHDPADRKRLLENRLFAVLADRLAATTDVIAAVRIAEWLESEPGLTDLVVDTAPGRNGIEFLRRPTALVSLMQGRLLGWLRHADDRDSIAMRVLRGLSRIGGIELLAELGELAATVQRPFRRVVDRLERAQAALRDPATEILLVTTVREDAARSSHALRVALANVGLPPSAVVVNRALPEPVCNEAASLNETSLDATGVAVLRYLRAQTELQARVVDGVKDLAPTTAVVSAMTGLDGDDRLARLTLLGGRLCDALAVQSVRSPASTATPATRTS
jgi:arsenite-transporting ATPase